MIIKIMKKTYILCICVCVYLKFSSYIYSLIISNNLVLFIHSSCRVSIWCSVFFVRSTRFLWFHFFPWCFLVFIFRLSENSHPLTHAINVAFVFVFGFYSFEFDLVGTNLVCLSFHDYVSICICTFTIFVPIITY